MILTKKDLQRITNILDEKIERIIQRLEKTQEKNELLLKENERLLEKIDRMTLKMEKMNIQNELLHATYLNAMALVNVYKQKVLELEKLLKPND